MYIIHFIFAWEVSRFLAPKITGIINGNISLLILYTMSVFASFGLALISEKYIEKPFIERGRTIINNMR
jgi:peptidoglycan/LPS O-acetylase OafA/YrhL